MKRLRESCKRGHPYTPENEYVYKGRRACRACRAIHRKRSLARAKERDKKIKRRLLQDRLLAFNKVRNLVSATS